MANKIKVGVRVRPFIEGEIGELKVNVTGSKIKMLSQTGPIYEFDHVFGPGEDTQGVFERLAEPIVTSVTKGFNGTIFAYGQTASGKTHTMMGDEKNELLSDQNLGIIPLSVIHLFSIMKKSNRQFIVRVSYMELYNESITDLQDSTNGNLQIRGDVHGGVYVDGLTETTCSNSEDVLAVLLAGKDNRTIRETKMNVRSSRSHTILTIILESRLSSEEDQDIVNLSYLHLVDLAGSEKISVSNSAISIKEGRFINLSLLTLGTVISKLSTKGDITHIPYRDSKLTRILQPALGGNANTAIICTVSPIVYEETESTLKFAQRAKHIANKPIVNEVYLSESAKDKKIAYLQEENSSLKKQLRCYTHDKENSPVNVI
jgi:centromeric protein E